MPRLTLLTSPAWDGRPLGAPRVVRLLAALAGAGTAGASDSDLIADVWETPVTHAGNALQVVVSRGRRSLVPEAIVRTHAGYALGVARHEVDAWLLADIADAVGRALSSGQFMDVVTMSAPIAGFPLSRADGAGPLGRLRRAARQHRRLIDRALGIALGRLGRHAEALPLLEDAALGDDPVLAALLRSLAAVRGAPVALARYETVRRTLSDRLGVDPSPALREVYAELLVADRPVRTGVESETEPLLGRETDLVRARTALASARVVTLLGVGGIGKTTLAHALAREAGQPRVHVVPLVTVRDDVDVADAVAAHLDVPDPHAGGAVDATGSSGAAARIAAQLAGPPVLLVLDNCEQTLDGVSELVAFLVASTPRLTVLVTSRAPLTIAAERVVPLSPLPRDVAAVLLRRRVAAVRPDAATPDRWVNQIVDRMDGLPLALELAAAQARWMSLGEIAAALGDRFALLRGGVRGAPRRHRTLEAVIEWSWDLLGDDTRRALAWLSSFRTPFGREGAASVLGAMVPPVGVEAVRHLTDHSLLTAVEGPDGTRFQFLETVREFGATRLAAWGQTAAAERAVRDWVLAIAARYADEVDPVYGPVVGRPALTALVPELPEASDVLRRAVQCHDLDTVLDLGPHLAQVLRGDPARFTALRDGAHLLAMALPHAPSVSTPRRREAARSVLAGALAIESLMGGPRAAALRAALSALGPGEHPSVRAETRVALIPEDDTGLQSVAELESLTRTTDDATALAAWRILVTVRYFLGDRGGALAAADQALALLPPDDSYVASAVVRMMRTQLLLQQRRFDEAADDARAARRGLLGLRAREADEMSVVLAIIEAQRGHLDAARRELASVSMRPSALGRAYPAARRVLAEITARSGERSAGLALFRSALDDAESWVPPHTAETDTAVVLTAASFTTALAQWHDPAEGPPAEDLYQQCLTSARALLSLPRVDLPLVGGPLFAAAYWRHAVHRDSGTDTARLFALAERAGHHLFVSAVTRERARADVDRLSSGAWTAAEARYADLDSRRLCEEAVALLTRAGTEAETRT